MKTLGVIGSRYYRICYNVVSLVTLIPLVLLSWHGRGDIVFSWSGAGVGVRWLLLGVALYCFWAGAKGYDLRYFLGLQQLQDGQERLLLGENASFSTAGIFGIVRHPWYLGSLLFIWSMYGTYHEKNFAVAVILSLYLLAGTILEERKIVAEYGDRYREYQAKVSMFIPLKWLGRRKTKKQ